MPVGLAIALGSLRLIGGGRFDASAPPDASPDVSLETRSATSARSAASLDAVSRSVRASTDTARSSPSRLCSAAAIARSRGDIVCGDAAEVEVFSANSAILAEFRNCCVFF
jgi:hypothetical protein